MVLLTLADQLDNLRAALPKTTPRQETFQGGITGPTRERSQSRHSLTEKSPASSSHEQDVALKADKLGDVVAPSMSLHCEDVKGSGKGSQFQDI